MTNSRSDHIFKSFNSAHFKEIVPEAGAIFPLWFLSFILDFGE
jgi:hypothetical protein